MSIKKEKIADYNFLEIVKIIIDNQESIEFYHSDNYIYSSNEKRANLFFLFNSLLLIGGKLPILNVVNYFNQLLDDVIIAFNTTLKNKQCNKEQLLNDHIVFGLYIVFSTVLDFLLGLPYRPLGSEEGYISSQSEEDRITVRIKEISKKYQIKRRKIEEQYLNKINYEEEMEINKELQNDNKFLPFKLTNKKSFSFELYQKNKYLSQDSDQFFINVVLSPVNQLCGKLNEIGQIIDNEKYLIDIIKNNTPSILNIYLAQIIYYFPLFKDHYKVLMNEEIIVEGRDNLLWRRNKVSLTEYFNYIFLKHSYLKNSIKKDKKDRTPWAVLERTFNETNLKNSFSSRTENLSPDFVEIKKLLKL
jgi:hypothetical protein